MTPEHALRAGYYVSMNGNITHSGELVPIFDAYAVPPSTKYPYILISNIQIIEIPNDSCKFYRANVTVDIVTGTLTPTGRSDAWAIAEQVESIINPDTMADIDITAYGWYVGETRLETSSNLESKANNYYIYRNIRSYNHLISHA